MAVALSSTIDTRDSNPQSSQGQPPEVVLQITCDYPELAAFPYNTWVKELLGDLAPEATSVGIRFVSDEEMRQFNFQYRGIDRATDVLSFPGDKTSEGFHLGDLVIAVPWTRRQAADNKVSVSTEIRMLVLHGVLHCLGFDHETDDGEMKEIEDELRLKWVVDVG